MVSSLPPRQLPYVNEMNEYFWRGSQDGRLRILRCSACKTWIHPYAGRCPKCRSPKIRPEPVSGQGTVAGFSVNHQPWIPGVPTPYVVAIVELEEQSNIRLMTNLPLIPIDDVAVGMKVKVYFEPHGDIRLPLFEAA